MSSVTALVLQTQTIRPPAAISRNVTFLIQSGREINARKALIFRQESRKSAGISAQISGLLRPISLFWPEIFDQTQQHARARVSVGQFDMLGRVMADAAAAAHEQHGD